MHVRTHTHTYTHTHTHTHIHTHTHPHTHTHKYTHRQCRNAIQCSRPNGRKSECAWGLSAGSTKSQKYYRTWWGGVSKREWHGNVFWVRCEQIYTHIHTSVVDWSSLTLDVYLSLAYLWAHTHIHTHTYTLTRTHTLTHTHVYAHTPARVHTHTHAHTHAHISTHQSRVQLHCAGTKCSRCHKHLATLPFCEPVLQQSNFERS